MQNLLFSHFHLVCSISSILVMIFSFIIVFIEIYYTEKLSRISLILICKYLFLLFVFFLHLCFSIHNQLNIFYSYSTKVISSFCIANIFLLQVAMNIQYYLNLRNPCYILKHIFNNELGVFLFIFIILVSSILIAILPYYFQSDITTMYDFVLPENNDNYFNVYFQDNKLLSPLIIIEFLGTFYVFFQIRKFYRNLKEKSLEHLKYANAIFLIINILYLAFGLFLLIMKFCFDGIHHQIPHLIFIFLSVCDSYLNTYRIYHSGYYYYFLNKTFIGYVFNILFFGCCNRKTSFPKNRDLSTTKHTQSINNFYYLKNYIIEDYILDTLDFILQSITTGLSIVYEDFRRQTYYFKSKIDLLSVENERIKANPEISNNSTESNLLSINDSEEKDESKNNKEKEEDESTSNMNSLYNFFKVCSRSFIGDKSENDLFSFNNCEDANVIIAPIFVNESIESINLYKINKHEIIKSLLSHKFLSLLLTNSKRIFFKNVNNLIISTYDSKYLIELHTDIKISSSFNNLLRNYFQYLNYGNLNSFLCVLIGVFRVKINNFKEIVIFLSQNPLVEKIPGVYYNYWEIMKFNLESRRFMKLVSSKDNDTFIIMPNNEDNSITLSKDKHHTFYLDDFGIFKQTIKNDLIFLKSISSNNFCLILLYYELENKIINKNSIFAEQKTKLNYDLPSSLFKGNSQETNQNKKLTLSPPNSNNSNKPDNTIINEKSDDSIDKEIIINNDIKKKTDDISNISDFSNNSKSMIIQNGFDASFNNYRGLLYFRWDNIFYQKKCSCDQNFYTNYINYIMKYFSN